MLIQKTERHGWQVDGGPQDRGGKFSRQRSRSGYAAVDPSPQEMPIRDCITSERSLGLRRPETWNLRAQALNAGSVPLLKGEAAVIADATMKDRTMTARRFSKRVRRSEHNHVWADVPAKQAQSFAGQKHQPAVNLWNPEHNHHQTESLSVWTLQKQGITLSSRTCVEVKAS